MENLPTDVCIAAEMSLDQP